MSPTERPEAAASAASAGPAATPNAAATLIAAETFVDRRRLRRGLAFWRIAAIIAAALFVLALVWRSSAPTPATSEPHIARIDVTGVIGNDEKLLDLIETVGERDSARALIVRIDSPGGTAVGGEAHFLALRKVAEEKPVVAQVDTLAASAGYMVAAAADHIVARNTSIVGSIGVIVQVPNVDELLDRIGVEVREIKSSPLKAEPSPFNPIEPQDEAMMRRMVMDSYEWFVSLVGDRRGFDEAKARSVADGSVFSGRQGVENGLVDAIGGEAEALDHLGTLDVDPELPVILYEPRREDGSLASIIFGAAGRVGLDAVARLAEAVAPLDGMVALWQGPQRTPSP